VEYKQGYAQRIVIAGNSGSGKSHTALRFAQAFALPLVDLDQIFWLADGYGTKRDEIEARSLVEKAAAQPAWVIEGVFGALCGIALQKATGLIWLDVPWEECRAGLTERGLRRDMTQADHAKLVAWAADYWTRDNLNSFAGHLRLYDAFSGWKQRFKSRREVDRFVAGLPAPPSPNLGGGTAITE
jgi:adenylate kinase family enzyme